jgi:hypothetical protein
MNKHHEELVLLPQIISLAAPLAVAATYFWRQYIRHEKPNQTDNNDKRKDPNAVQ